MKGRWVLGEVVIQNKSEHTLAGWEVEFDFAGEMKRLEGSVVARSGSRYTVRGEMQNPDVSPGGAVLFSSMASLMNQSRGAFLIFVLVASVMVPAA